MTQQKGRRLAQKPGRPKHLIFNNLDGLIQVAIEFTKMKLQKRLSDAGTDATVTRVRIEYEKRGHRNPLLSLVAAALKAFWNKMTQR